MRTARQNLIELARVLASHQNVTHWAISMRLFGKGDFFKRLLDNENADVRTRTYKSALKKFADAWPRDLEWPADIPRPAAKRDEADE